MISHIKKSKTNKNSYGRIVYDVWITNKILAKNHVQKTEYKNIDDNG